MSFVDRSNTNWTPWPRLAGIPQRLQVVGGVAAIMGIAGAWMAYRQRVGAPPPSTITPEWKAASQTPREREAGDPIEVNPITKHMKKN